MEAIVRTAIIAAAVFGWFVSVSESSAQPPARPSWSLGATAGAGKTWDDEGSIGSGWLIGGYVQRRLTTHMDLELSGDLLRHERNTGPFSFRADGHTTYFGAALVGRFGPPDANFFLLGGGTLGIHRGEAGLGDAPALNQHESTNVGFIFGGGLSFRTSNGLEIAPLVRMTVMRVDDDADPFSSIMAGVRIGR
jgi:hypothetical protein